MFRNFVASAFAVALVAVAGVAFGLPPIDASASPSMTGRTGDLKITINAPEGIAANVIITHDRRKAIASKATLGTSATVSMTLPQDNYEISAPPVLFGGALYIGWVSKKEIVVKAKVANAVTATYTLSSGARDLHVVKLAPSTVSLTWAAGQGSAFGLFRLTGVVKPSQNPEFTGREGKLKGGVFVPSEGTTATDSGLEAGRVYSYVLFSKVKNRWTGQIAISVRTSAPAGSSAATYVATPGSLLATSADIVSAVPTGAGVEVVLAGSTPTPLIGSGVVLPISADLPGGYLGVVDSESADGQTLKLSAGGLADAFDYYELSVNSFTSDPALLPEPVPTAEEPPALTSSSPFNKSAAPLVSAASPGNSDRALTQLTKPTLGAKGLATAAALPGVDCGQISGTGKITFLPSVALGGHFNTKLDKYSQWGITVPTGASLDMALTAKAVGAVDVQTAASVGCKLTFKKVAIQISATPVPMWALFEPIANITISSPVKASNIGVTTTGGLAIKATLTASKGISASASVLAEASPLTPQVTSAAQIEVKLGGQLTVGPGAITENAGVIAGLKGELDLLDGVFKPYFPPTDPKYNSCTEISAKMNVNAGLTAKAWVGKLSNQADLQLPIAGPFNYPGSPWDFPKGCNVAQTPPDSLFGPGVAKVNESATGAPSQSGYVAGFIPGKNTWVLSTGNISDAVGSPGSLASTALGLPGDAALGALSGNPTFDAVSYQVTVVPAGTNLHVRYAFATEEFPDFVGSQFNDVMAVYVNGTNCAFVPGTNVPVSVNTINTGTNSQYFVDNRTGAAGFNTTMNGITVPLTCSVPVTPGQPVTVRIAVADSSDAILDSAVALVDGGIWSD